MFVAWMCCAEPFSLRSELASCVLRWLAVWDMPRLIRAKLVAFCSSLMFASSLRVWKEESVKKVLKGWGCGLVTKRRGPTRAVRGNGSFDGPCLALDAALAALQIDGGDFGRR